VTTPIRKCLIRGGPGLLPGRDALNLPAPWPNLEETRVMPHRIAGGIRGA